MLVFEMDVSFGHFTCIRIQCKSTVGNTYNGSSRHVKRKNKLFWEKLWAIKNFFARFKWKFFEYSHANGTL